MSAVREYRQGAVICSLDVLREQEAVFCDGRLFSREYLGHLALKDICRALDAGRFCLAEEVTQCTERR